MLYNCDMNTEQIANSVAKPKISKLVIASFVLLPLGFPYIALPLAIMALSRIKKSNGLLTGRNGAIIAIVLNSLLLLISLVAIIHYLSIYFEVLKQMTDTC